MEIYYDLERAQVYTNICTSRSLVGLENNDKQAFETGIKR